MVSRNSTLPILVPLRRFETCGAPLMLSMPPATTTCESPLWIAWQPSATDFNPEPQRMLTP